LEDEDIEEIQEPPQRDLQAEKFEEYKQYVLDTNMEFLETFKEYSIKVKEGVIKEGS
jgi:hypothetical protein